MRPCYNADSKVIRGCLEGEPRQHNFRVVPPINFAQQFAGEPQKLLSRAREAFLSRFCSREAGRQNRGSSIAEGRIGMFLGVRTEDSLY